MTMIGLVFCFTPTNASPPSTAEIADLATNFCCLTVVDPLSAPARSVKISIINKQTGQTKVLLSNTMERVSEKKKQFCEFCFFLLS